MRWIVLWSLIFLAACSGSGEGGAPVAALTPTPSTGLTETAASNTAAANTAATNTAAVITAAVITAVGTPPLPSTGPTIVPTAKPLAQGTETLFPPTHTQIETSTPERGIEPPAGLQNAGSATWRPITGGVQQPIGLANAGDGSGRLFILEKPGRIRIFQEGNLLPEVFIDLTDRIGSGGSEQGLLGLDFHPGFIENGFFYVNYSDLQGDTIIARFQVSGEDPNRARLDSELRLLYVDQPYANHNGGAVKFGQDGYLYLGLGDGGSAGDPLNNAQSLESLLGKILRIDVDHGEPYAIPEGNPYAQGGGRPEIWAFGLRNPWRLGFDSQTGDLYIGDVGQNQWEEIDFLTASEITKAGRTQAFNFGWNYLEGNHSYSGTQPAGLETIAPIAEYNHQLGCSVTGGEVYRGSQLPDWQGIYLFGDYCNGRIWGLWQTPQGEWLQEALFENQGLITAFGTDEQGEIFLADQAGIIYQLAAR